MLYIGVSTIILAQWLILEECILSRLENEDGSNNLIAFEWISNTFALPIDATKKGWIMINTISPFFAQLSRLCNILGL